MEYVIAHSIWAGVVVFLALVYVGLVVYSTHKDNKAKSSELGNQELLRELVIKVKDLEEKWKIVNAPRRGGPF